MINIYTLNHPNNLTGGSRLNMEELYEKQRKRDEKQAEVYRKVLNRAHEHIRKVARKGGLPCTWFTVPPVVMGVPNYDQAGCIAYLIDQLQENKFVVKFYYPNHLFITWNHIVPKYVRDEIRQKTGVELDEYGYPIPQEDDEDEVDMESADAYQQLSRNALASSSQSKGKHGAGAGGTTGRGRGGGGRGGRGGANDSVYTPIEAYRPSGKMVYRDDTMNRLNKRLSQSADRGGNRSGGQTGRGRNADADEYEGIDYGNLQYNPDTFNEFAGKRMGVRYPDGY